jgi:pimeloyl-ACP methyl ester carboxylesterase
MNGDLRVAYRASPPGVRDIVFVPNWFTCCEHLPELPSIQGWVEAMTSLGRLIFFDQPGSGASDPVEPGAMPTLEQWADSITAVLDALGSPGAALVTWPGAFPTAALFAATHPSRTTALIVLQAQDPHSGRPNGAAVLAVERRSRPGRCKGIGGQRDRSATSSIDRAHESAQRTQLGGGGLPLPRLGDAVDVLWPHHTGRRAVASTPERSPSASVTAGAAEVKTRRPRRR